MKYFKALQILVLSFTLLSCANAQTPKMEEKTTNKTINEKIEACEPTLLTDAKTTEIKTIAEGAMSEIETPFVFAARDAKTFELLKTSVKDLPAASTIDFNKNGSCRRFCRNEKHGRLLARNQKIG